MPITSTKLDGNKLTVEIELEEELRDSSTGKTEIVASSAGPVKTEVIVDGRPVWIVASAFVKKVDTKAGKLKKAVKEMASQVVGGSGS